jgi:hypothetical protein
MTEQEFDAGWALLISQPFAFLYQRDPAAEAVQRRLYFEKLKWSDGRAWMKVATGYACGGKWPPIDEIIPALRNAQPKLRQVEDLRSRECPAAVEAVFGYYRTEGVSIIAAMRAVLPLFVEQHPDDQFAREMLNRMTATTVEASR